MSELQLHILAGYALVAFLYWFIYGGTRLPSMQESVFAALVWPLDIARFILCGARDWWSR